MSLSIRGALPFGVGPVAAIAALGTFWATTSEAAASALPKTMTGRVIAARAGTSPRGTVLKASAIFTPRVFWNAQDGFALANGGQAQYPVFTTNRGSTWRIAGPALHVNAADAPAVVQSVGVKGSKIRFAYGPEVVDVTSNNGGTWYQVFPQGQVVAVVPSLHGIAAYVQTLVGKNKVTTTYQYVSRNGGRSWSLWSSVGG